MARILIVEHDEDIAEMTQLFLDQNGYDTAVACDGVAAMSWLNEETPALVLSDLMMPIASGAELVSWMRQRDRLRDVPVILVSAAFDPGVGRGQWQAFLRKPVPPATLLRTVRAALATFRNEGGGDASG